MIVHPTAAVHNLLSFFLKRVGRTLQFWGSMGRILVRYYMQERDTSATEEDWQVKRILLLLVVVVVAVVVMASSVGHFCFNQVVRCALRAELLRSEVESIYKNEKTSFFPS